MNCIKLILRDRLVFWADFCERGTLVFHKGEKFLEHMENVSAA